MEAVTAGRDHRGITTSSSAAVPSPPEPPPPETPVGPSSASGRPPSWYWSEHRGPRRAAQGHSGPPWAAQGNRGRPPRVRPWPSERRPEQGILGGVVFAAADRRGRDPLVWRAIVLLVGVVTGVGAAAYLAAWLLIPAEGERQSIASRALRDSRAVAMVLALVPLLVVALLFDRATRLGWLGSPTWSAFAAGVGVIVVWRDGSPAERVRLARTGRAVLELAVGARGSWRTLVSRLAGAAVLLAAAAAGLALGLPVVGQPLVAVAFALAGVLLAVGPWWVDLGRQLVTEREARLRAEDRAEIASRVHDSVLQTLALIQRHADDPVKVGQLARLQERELRSWLFEGRRPGDQDPEVPTLAEGVRRLQSEVEAAHGVTVETVVVGDAPVTPEVDAILAAAREAAVNAAKWSGAPSVALFAEVDAATVSIFVRDRGRGFDWGGVAADRRGVSQSIEGRMARIGGAATVRSARGEGTEVALTVALRAPPGRWPISRRGHQ